MFVLLLMMFATNSFASGIASNTASAPCTNTTLETYSGNSNLSADWQPNEIQLRWYNNNTLMDVQSAANTCTYDDTLTVPSTAPTRTGYTFAGWTVRPEMDFAGLNLTNGLERWGKGHTQTCYHALGDVSAEYINCNKDSNFIELEQDEWKSRHDENGKTVYGMAVCSKKPGNDYNKTWPQQNLSDYWSGIDTNTLKNYTGADASAEAHYCWCKATGYKASNDAIVQGSLNKLAWVCAYDLDSIGSTCEFCAYYCAAFCFRSANFRRALFLPAN